MRKRKDTVRLTLRHLRKGIIFLIYRGFLYVPENDSYALHEAMDDTVCAVMLELVHSIVEKSILLDFPMMCFVNLV